ncbi:hypothetical protein [Pseudomonas oryzihabitans]|uniref:Uncharacterized protein n=1 Tax=Pseudomonas oryzihabitans TaxID=47885 RepID=A0AAJ2BJL4_9PSED|nr:hypothetical protein [Pseudomonas psychrotolerans]MDR6232476.1 hypothetical protein [Pseudomonas psychrotolerans]MDR6358604.1 hypothetical protein [Pseudomonas psychrotolerans]
MRTQLTRSITLFEPEAASASDIDADTPIEKPSNRSGAERAFTSLLLGLSVCFTVLGVIPLFPLRYWL